MSTLKIVVNPDQAVSEWAARIASTADLGDARLAARLAVILEFAARQPGVGIPQAAGDKHQAKAAYRFFSNRRVTDENLIEGVGAATAAKCAGAAKIYAVQDTTSVNYSGLKTTVGLGPLNDSPTARGLHVHSTVAVGADGVLQGLLDQNIWARSGERTADKRKERPIQEKESFKWIDAIRSARSAFADQPPAERPGLVHVMDREGDIHEVFEEIQEGEEFLIRCAQNRNIDEMEGDAIGKSHDAVRQSACRGTMHLPVFAPGKKSRTAKLELRATEVTLAPRDSKRRPVALTLIEAREIGAPADTKPILWRLWTNQPARTLSEIVGCVRHYSFRWRIEEYHLTLKSGCGIEKLELETAERLAKAIVVYSVVAIRIVALRDLGKRQPDTCCTAILNDLEWRLLVRHFEKRIPKPNEKPPTIRQAMRYIGRLGGHLDRKADGLPGVRTLWRGWRDLALMVAGYRAAMIDR